MKAPHDPRILLHGKTENGKDYITIVETFEPPPRAYALHVGEEEVKYFKSYGSALEYCTKRRLLGATKLL